MASPWTKHVAAAGKYKAKLKKKTKKKTGACFNELTRAAYVDIQNSRTSFDRAIESIPGSQKAQAGGFFKSTPLWPAEGFYVQRGRTFP